MAEHKITSITNQANKSGEPIDPDLLSTQLGLSTTLARKIVEIGNAPDIEILNDQPSTEDDFGMSALTRIVADIVISNSTQTPISIGIDGEWGTGKTSMLRMIEAHARLLNHPCIWLNAWHLENTENLIAAVASEIQREVISNKRYAKQEPTFRKRLGEWVAQAGQTLLGVGLGLSSTATLTVETIAKGRERDIAELASIVTTRQSFVQLVDLLFRDSKDEDNRLIIFIDDIDRALPDQITTLLKNLKLILEVPKCVFVFAMDMRMVARAIENYYQSNSQVIPGVRVDAIHGGSVEINQTVSSSIIGEGFGFNYLEKLVQIRIQTPPLNREKVKAYLKKNEVLPEVQEIIHWAPDSEILNPRRLKQYLNWLSISLRLISSVELPPQADTITVLRLMAVARDYPDIYQAIINKRLKNIDPQELILRRSYMVDYPSSENMFNHFIQSMDVIGLWRISIIDHFIQSNPILGIGRRGYTVSQQIDMYESYEIGISRMMNRIKPFENEYSDALVLEQRLLENISRSRQFGDSESTRADRFRIIDALNRIALSTLGVPFNELTKQI
jgi:hypothetical protein